MTTLVQYICVHVHAHSRDMSRYAILPHTRQDLSVKGNTEVNIADQIPDPQVAKLVRRDSNQLLVGERSMNLPDERTRGRLGSLRAGGATATLTQEARKASMRR